MTASCDCKAALEWCARKGGQHSKRMLALSIPESQWPSSDLLMHLSEEERFFFPYLPLHIQRLLAAHHAQFRREIREYGKIVDLALLKQHAEVENKYAKELLRAA